VRQALHAAVAHIDAAFLEEARDAGLRDGATIAFALFVGRHFIVGSVGDSRAVLCTLSSPEGRPARAAGSKAVARAPPQECAIDLDAVDAPVPDLRQCGVGLVASTGGLAPRTARGGSAAEAGGSEDAERSAGGICWAPRLEDLSAVPMTDDHAPDRADERQRILEAGGKVLLCPQGKRSFTFA
jgi:Protein phosphatase 2C